MFLGERERKFREVELLVEHKLITFSKERSQKRDGTY